MLKISQLSENPYKNDYNKNTNFKGKINYRNKYVFDTDLIKNFSEVDNRTLLNLKERILHSIPSEMELNNYYANRTCIYERNAVQKLPSRYNNVEVVGSYEHRSGATAFDNVYTPSIADVAAEEYDNYFWSKYGVAQLLIDMPCEQFLEIYKEAILPENAAKVYDV